MKKLIILLVFASQSITAQYTDINIVKEVKVKNKGLVVFVKNTPWKAGDILIQKEPAETLKLIQRSGLKGFYERKTTDLIVAERKRKRDYHP